MKQKLSILFLLSNLYLFAQCNVKTVVPLEGFKNHSMSQILWDSTKSRLYSEGVDGYYMFVNNLTGDDNKSLEHNTIVISHVMLNYNSDEVPNMLTLVLPSGIIEKKASIVNYNTLNIYGKTTPETKTIECEFTFTIDEVRRIMDDKKFHGIKIENYKNGKVILMINQNDIYSGQLSEMFKCTNFISLN